MYCASSNLAIVQVPSLFGYNPTLCSRVSFRHISSSFKVGGPLNEMSSSIFYTFESSPVSQQFCVRIISMACWQWCDCVIYKKACIYYRDIDYKKTIMLSILSVKVASGSDLSEDANLVSHFYANETFLKPPLPNNGNTLQQHAEITLQSPDWDNLASVFLLLRIHYYHLNECECECVNKYLLFCRNLLINSIFQLLHLLL